MNSSNIVYIYNIIRSTVHSFSYCLKQFISYKLLKMDGTFRLFILLSMLYLVLGYRKYILN